MTNQFTKEVLDSLVSEVNYQQDGFEDEDHSFDVFFTKEQYDKLIELGWNDNDFDCVEFDDGELFVFIKYFPCNEDSYSTVEDVIVSFFQQIGIDVEAPCNG